MVVPRERVHVIRYVSIFELGCFIGNKVGMLSKFFVAICRQLLRVGIFKNISFLFIASTDFGCGTRCYDRGDYSGAFNVLTKYEDNESEHKLVKVVLAEIKYYLAIMYFYGRGIEIDKVRASQLFASSAKYGNEKAREYLSKL